MASTILAPGFENVYSPGMNKEELAQFLAAMKQVREANTATPETARLFLQKEGYLEKDGSVAEYYSSAQSSDHK